MAASWENDAQRDARIQFIDTWRESFPIARLTALSMVWCNMKFLGCRYPASVEEIVKDLESKAPILVREKAIKRPNPVIKNFTIYHPAEKEDSINNNPVSILNESSQKSKKTVFYSELGVDDKTNLYSCAVVIEDNVIAVGNGTGKKQAKRDAAEKALAILRSCQPVVRVGAHQHEKAPCVTRGDIVSRAYQNAPNISIDNIGNQMLRKMGWTGRGGIGKEGQGRAEPVMALGTDGRSGLGCDITKGAAVNKLSVQDILMSFLSGADNEIKFSNELSREERALVHILSQRYGLKHRSYGKGEDRYLVVSKN